MSITGVVDYKKPSHRRNDSGELDVFEAARYFSEYNDNFTLVGGSHRNHHHHPMMVIKEERDHQGHVVRGGRISLDIPSLKHHHYYYQQHQQQHHHHQQQQQPKEKKHKQPSSPGGKLAHFLNSIFSQTITSKKKKPSSKSLSTSTTQSMKDIIINDDESPNGRRKRRSSISHFSLRSTTSSNATVDTKSLYSCSSSTNSGFRTPPPYALNTPTKSYRSFNSDHNNKEVFAKKEYDQKQHKFIKNGVVEKPKNHISKNNNNHGEKKRDHQVSKFKEEIDDGAESDSSSDLFELQIDYGFGFCSSGLPVYETTHMDNIKRSSANHAITNGPLKN